MLSQTSSIHSQRRSSQQNVYFAFSCMQRAIGSTSALSESMKEMMDVQSQPPGFKTVHLLTHKGPLSNICRIHGILNRRLRSQQKQTREEDYDLVKRSSSTVHDHIRSATCHQRALVGFHPLPPSLDLSRSRQKRPFAEMSSPQTTSGMRFMWLDSCESEMRPEDRIGPPISRTTLLIDSS